MAINLNEETVEVTGGETDSKCSKVRDLMNGLMASFDFDEDLEDIDKALTGCDVSKLNNLQNKAIFILKTMIKENYIYEMIQFRNVLEQVVDFSELNGDFEAVLGDVAWNVETYNISGEEA